MEAIKVTELEDKILSGHGGYFRVESPRGIGIVDVEGTVVVRPYYPDVSICPEDGPVEMLIRRRHAYWIPEDETLFDLLEPDGTVLLQDEYGDPIGFREGIMVVKNKSGLFAMNTYGRHLFDVRNTHVLSTAYRGLFHDGMLRIPCDPGHYYCYIDRNGANKIGNWQLAGDFHDGLAVAAVERPFKMRYGVLNKEGRWVVKPGFDYIGDFCQYRAIAKKDGKLGFLDTSGNLLVPCLWDVLFDFDSEGLAFARTNRPDFACLIDRVGRPVLLLPRDCVWAGSFSEDLLAARTEKGLGYLDREGKWVIPPRYGYGGDFFSGVAPVEKDGKWCFIDREGKEVLAVEGTLHMAAKGLAHNDSCIFNYGYTMPGK